VFNDLSHNPTRIAYGHAVSWNVAHNHAPGLNHAVVTDRNARTDDAASTEPDIVADHDWFCGL
jgi:hypothetical protein